MAIDTVIDLELNLPRITASANRQEEKPLLALIAAHRQDILEQLDQYGAVLFRGFACCDEDYFSKAIALCDLGRRCDTSDYDLPRTVLRHDIYTSSDLPPSIPLPLHHEKPRSKNPPHTLYFCCVTPAQKGGGTIIANAESIWLDMSQIIQNKIKKYGVVYKQFFHGVTRKQGVLKQILGEQCARSWSEYFATNKKEQIEQKLIQDGCDWKWVNKQRDLIAFTYLPGVLPHPRTHQLCWFNSAAYLNYYANFVYGELKQLAWPQYLAARYMILKDLFPIICHCGNGSAFSEAEVLEIQQVIENHTRVVQWQQGDFMILDNFTWMHGKQPHEGNRLLYSCMTENISPSPHLSPLPSA